MVQPKTRRLVTEDALQKFVNTQAAEPVATLAELPSASANNRGLIRFVTAENEPYYSNGTTWSSIAQGAQGNPGPAGAGVPAGGSALQVVRKNSLGTTTEWVTPTKSMVGLTNVDNTADSEKPVSLAAQQSLDAKQPMLTEDPSDPGILGAGPNSKIPTVDSNYNLPAKVLSWLATKFVGKGDLHVNVKDYGAKGDGVADDTAAWIAAEAAAFAKGPDYVLSAPYGIYRTSGQITVRCALEAGQSTIRYYGTGVALVIGDESTLGKVTPRRKYNLPRVINMARGTTGWDGSSVGVKLVNLDTCNLYVPFVQDFEQGLVLSGMGAGVAYCTITLGALWDNHKNLVLTNDATGWANQNTFIGGRLNQTLWKGAFLDDPNANQLSMVSDTSFGGPNNNTFVGTSFEGVNISLNRLDISGKYNQFVNCRWENFGTPFLVRYREFAEWNRIIGGYGSSGITEVFDGTRGGGAIDDPLGSYTLAQNTSGQIIPNSVNTTITSWGTPTGRRIPYNPSTGEFTPRPGRWAITATVTFAPKATGRRIARIKYGTDTLDVAEAPGTTGSTERITLKLNTSLKSDGHKKLIVECNQSSGADLALESSAWYVKFQAEYLGG